MTFIHFILLAVNVAAFTTCVPVHSGWTSTSAAHEHTEKPTLSTAPQQQESFQLFGAKVQPGRIHTDSRQMPSSSTTSHKGLHKDKGIPLFGARVQSGQYHNGPEQPRSSSSASQAEQHKGKGIHLFGVKIHPIKADTEVKNLSNDGPLIAAPSPLKPHEIKAQTSTYRRKKWLDAHVPISRQDSYEQLVGRLNISDNWSVKRHLIATLTPSEKRAIEERDEAKIKEIIHTREYLIRYAPLEFPEHRRPGPDRIEKLKMKLDKRKGIVAQTVHGRNRKGWHSSHSIKEADAIRQKAKELHGVDQIDKHLSRKIADMTVEERLKALDNDPEALYKLAPMKVGRPTNEMKRKTLEDLKRKSTALNSGVERPNSPSDKRKRVE